MRFPTPRLRRRAVPSALAAIAISILPALLWAAAQVAGDRLPVFELTGLDGKVLRSDELRMKHDWVLVYVRPDCRPCDGVFAELGDGSAVRTPAQAAAAEEREMRRERAAAQAAAA